MKMESRAQKATGVTSDIQSNMYHRLNICILVIFTGVLLFQGCTGSHILNQREGLSRTWIYIDFSRNQHPYETESIVGGEHMTFYKVLGFENDEFTVTVETFKAIEARVDWGISGDGIRIESLPDQDGKEKKRVTVDASEAIFTVDFSAHPYGEYKLRIEKQ